VAAVAGVLMAATDTTILMQVLAAQHGLALTGQVYQTAVQYTDQHNDKLFIS